MPVAHRLEIPPIKSAHAVSETLPFRHDAKSVIYLTQNEVDSQDQELNVGRSYILGQVADGDNTIRLARLNHPCAWNRPFRRFHPVARRTFRRDVFNAAAWISLGIIICWLVRP